MPSVKVRDIAKLGVICDTDSYALPIESFSWAQNVRFEDGSVTSGPIFRRLGTTPTVARHLLSFEDANETNHTFYVAENGSLLEWLPSGETNRSPSSGWTPSISDAVITSTRLQGVTYINRSDRTPWYRAETSTSAFSTLETYNSATGAAQFAGSWRFNALRATANLLIGINVTMSGVNFPTMIKWSNFATNFGTPPKDWDVTVTTSSSGENILGEMDGNLVDGCRLGNNMLLYGTKETWLLEYIGGNDIFRTRRLFGSGVINVNCVVERDSAHYVFGTDDLFVTDGTRRDSLAAGRVKKMVFNSIVQAERSLFFTTYNPMLDEVMFCYVSSDKHCAFPYGLPFGNRGCNRAAAYSIRTKNWTFYDLPYVTSAALGPAGTTGLSWETAATWETVGGSYAGAGDDAKNAVLFAAFPFNHAAGAQPSAIRSFELFGTGATVSNLDTVATAPPYMEKAQIDLDETGADLSGVKLLSHIWPEIQLSPDSQGLVFEVGSAEHSNGPFEFNGEQTFTEIEPRLDYDCAGRFLYMKIRAIPGDAKPFTMTGFDLDLQIISEQ